MTATAPVILGIDTCEGNCSVAIIRGDDVLAVRSDAIGRGHAEHLLPMIDELLAEAGISYQALDRLAVTTGPGTFTGLRIGLSVARGLALALDIPCVGITSLMVLAAQAKPVGGTVHAVIAGRGGQGFHQAFDARDFSGLPQPLGDGANCDISDIAAKLAIQPGILIGSGAALLGQHDAEGVDPVTLARLAALVTPGDFPPEPTYFRDADAVKAKALLPTEQPAGAAKGPVGPS